MRYALISDIHANLPALEAVLEDLARRECGVGATYHLGDLVGYAPWPDETVARLRAHGVSGISGNYDSTVATAYKHCGCRYEDPRQEALSHESYAWTLARTSVITKGYLAALPFRLDLRPLGGHLAGPTLTLVHGTPTLNTMYWTQDRPDSFCSKMAQIAGLKAGDVIAFGHTHIPWHRQVDGIHFINAGSVGRPKDGDWRAAYVLLDLSKGEPDVQFVRIPYDIDRAVQGILASELPREYAEILQAGGGPIAGSAGESARTVPPRR